MKTYIISNGRRYSDHEVLFVEVQDGQEPLVSRFLEFCSRNQGDVYGIPKVMGIAEGAVSWRAPNSSMPLLTFVDTIAFCVCDEDVELSWNSKRSDARLACEYRPDLNV